MKIIFFSEIRWDYLKTRKQQIISRFPKDWEVLFLEPHKTGKKMNLVPAWYDNVCVATMPLFFKNFKPAIIKWLLSFKPIRFVILLVGWFWTKEIIRRAGFTAPDLIMCSNIYAAPFVKMLCKGLPVIYDMNDDHLAFPNTPKWAKDYYRSLCISANQIVLANESMKELLPTAGRFGNHVVSNGVDYDLFVDERKVILYVGAISDWTDIELLENVAKSFPDGRLRLVGPVMVNVDGLKSIDNVEFIGALDRQLTVEQIKQADVCLVPFKNCKITKHTAGINKIFEYLAAGKPVVSIGRPRADFENNHPGLIYSAVTPDEFIFYIGAALMEKQRRIGDTSVLQKSRKAFAREHDWNKKAEEMIKIIQQTVSN